MMIAATTRSETTKQFTTSAWWVLAVVLFAYIGFTAAVLAFVLSMSATGALSSEGPQVPDEGLAELLYSTATSVGYVFPLLIGTLMVTAEFRHSTLSPTFLATPRRSTVLWSKLLVGALLGVLYGIVGVIAAVAPSAAFLAGYGLSTEFASAETWALFGRMLLAYVLWVFVGVGIGALVRNQVGAIVGVLVFTQFIEPVARAAASFVDGLTEFVNYLPGAASDALVGASVFTGMMPGSTTDTLEWWVGGLVLLAYAAVLVVLGYLVSWRRDVS